MDTWNSWLKIKQSNIFKKKKKVERINSKRSQLIKARISKNKINPTLYYVEVNNNNKSNNKIF